MHILLKIILAWEIFKKKELDKIIDASKKSGAYEFVKDYDLKYKKKDLRLLVDVRCFPIYNNIYLRYNARFFEI